IRGGGAGEDPLPELSQQSDGRDRAAGISRIGGRFLPPQRDPPRLRQRLLRGGVRWLLAAVDPPDRWGGGGRRGVPLAFQDVQHDRLASRLGGRGGAMDYRVDAGEDLCRYGI